MKMEFVFDLEKLAETGGTEEQCLEELRWFFFYKFKGSSIVETEKGVFEGSMYNYSLFAAALNFRKAEWFQNTIKEWFWTEEYRSFKRHDIVAEMMA